MMEEADGPKQMQDEVAEEGSRGISQRLGAPDAILEPTVKADLVKFLDTGGDPGEVISLLSNTFLGKTQTIRSVSSWLSDAGMSSEDISSVAEQQLSSLIGKHFDPVKADGVFASEVVPTWIEGMVASSVWRDMVASLSESYPDCFFLKHATTIIDEKNYRTKEEDASQKNCDVPAFAEIVVDHVTAALRSLPDRGKYKDHIKELADVVYAEQHQFLYASALLQAASKLRHGHKVRRVWQDLVSCGVEKNYDVLVLSLVLSGSPGQQRAISCLRGMISRQALNPSDMAVLHRMYSSNNPPPVELIRHPTFIDLLITALFKPGNSVNPDQLPKYSYLLVYTGSVSEVRQGGLTVDASQLKDSLQAFSIVRAICRRADSSLSDLLAELPVLFQHLKLAIISMATLRWCAFTLSKESVFSIVTDTIPLPFVILDEIVSLHPAQHEEIFQIFTELTNSSYQTLDTLVQLELKKILMDRFLHLMSFGYALPVLKFILQCTEDKSFDRSVLRHFVSELLEMIRAPYSEEFMAALLPIVDNPQVTASLRAVDGSDPVSLFIAHCQEVK